MSLRSRFANRHKRADWTGNRILTPQGARLMSLHDADKPSSNGSHNPHEPAMVTKQMGYQHPPGFEPVAFFIVGMNKDCQVFVNMPLPQPHLCLHLATMGLTFASEFAVKHMQEAQLAKSPIVQVPGGVLPPWRGPEGRG